MKQLIVGVLLVTLAGMGLIVFTFWLKERIDDKNRREACAVLYPGYPDHQETCYASAVVGNPEAR